MCRRSDGSWGRCQWRRSRRRNALAHVGCVDRGKCALARGLVQGGALGGEWVRGRQAVLAGANKPALHITRASALKPWRPEAAHCTRPSRTLASELDPLAPALALVAPLHRCLAVKGDSAGMAGSDGSVSVWAPFYHWLGEQSPWLAAAFIVGTLVLANVIVLISRRCRASRISSLTAELAASGSAADQEDAKASDDKASTLSISAKAPKRTPVTIITGFLGSGAWCNFRTQHSMRHDPPPLPRAQARRRW